MELPLDPGSYAVRARLAPAILLVLPLGLACTVWFGEGWAAIGLLSTGVVVFALALLSMHFVRDRGKAIEGQLISEWGGSPSTTLLRHRDPTLNAITKGRYHARLARLVAPLAVPSAEDEAQNPDAADRIFESCAQLLRERTRDAKQYSLLLDENASYGFRRNMLGVRSIGLGTAIAGLAVCAVKVWFARVTGDASRSAMLAAGLNVVLTAVWQFLVTPAWVRQASTEYAKRLLGACEVLD